MVTSAYVGRDARLLKAGVEIGLGRNMSVSADADSIEIYSNDKLTPEITAGGKQTFKWSMERLFTDKTWMDLLIAGTAFDLIFAPAGSPLGSTKWETWSDCKVLHVERKGGETDGILENVSGEATGVTPKPA